MNPESFVGITVSLENSSIGMDRVSLIVWSLWQKRCKGHTYQGSFVGIIAKLVIIYIGTEVV